MQKYTNKYFSSFSLLMFRKTFNWFKPKVVREWNYFFRLRGFCAKFHFWCISWTCTKFKSPKKKYIKKKYPFNLRKATFLEAAMGREELLPWDGCAPGVWFPLRGCLLSQWIWSSYYDEVMAVPVSLGHALSAHSFSFSSVRRCCKQVIPRQSWCRELTNPKFEIPENTSSAFGSLDITRSLKQHSQLEKHRLFDKRGQG